MTGAVERRGACLDEDRIVAFYAGELGEAEADAVRTHLSECASCLELARDARQFLKAVAPESLRSAAPAAAAPVPARGAAAVRWVGLAAGLLIAASLVLSWLRSSSSPNLQEASGSPGAFSPADPTPVAPVPHTWDHLRIVKAPYAGGEPVVPDIVWRDGEAPPAGGDDTFARAMEAYQKDNFKEAERRLARLLSREPNRAVAQFYRGVSLLMLAKTSDAIPALDRARRGAERPLRDDALYYLALAHLKAGDPQAARAALDELLRSAGHRRADAERLRRDLDLEPRS